MSALTSGFRLDTLHTIENDGSVTTLDCDSCVNEAGGHTKVVAAYHRTWRTERRQLQDRRGLRTLRSFQEWPPLRE